MSELVNRVDLEAIGREEVPEPFRHIIEEGWIIDQSGAIFLRSLRYGYSGNVESYETCHKEAAVNNRGMIDYDLPTDGGQREAKLLRRCIAYARLGIHSSLSLLDTREVLSYITMSNSLGGDESFTASVTFCGNRSDSSPYITSLNDYEHEALMEISWQD
ncbi:hypothetical protein [Streptomyces sp. 6N223]|uniref:hypothetical protein n=1 Tax=Streptomyces sp. 6N223 TaxID=3457412 RepID=UPI003FD0AEB3